MKTYIINATGDYNRKAHMLDQLTKHYVSNYEFVEAETQPNPIEGCMKSHRKVWQMIADSKEDAIVMEDDVMLHDSYIFFLNKRLGEIPVHASVGLLGYQVKGTPMWHNMVPDWRCAQANQRVEYNGAYAYFVNGRQAALTLIELTNGIAVHPDMVMMEAANNGQLSMFFMNHPIVQHGGFPSTLNHNEPPKPANHPNAQLPPKVTAPDAQPASVKKTGSAWLKPINTKGLVISLLHPSRGRAEKAKATYDYWHKASSQQVTIEHVLSIDQDDPQTPQYLDLFKRSKIVVDGNKNVVEATNKAAKEATGNILVYLSDDFKCPENWDIALAAHFAGTKKPLLLQVADGINPITVECLTIPIMNRALYKKLGYFWHPGYKSMFVDNDLYHTCLNNQWLVKDADLTFEHHHWVNKKAEVDETYKRNDAHWKQGEKLFNERKQAGFPLK